MFQLVTPLKEKTPKVFKLIYHKPQLFADYSGSLSHKEFSSISDKFFELASLQVLKGFKLNTPLGAIRTKRFRHTKKRIDFKKWKNPELYDNIWKDHDYVDMIVWDVDLAKPYLRPYVFKAVGTVSRRLRHHEVVRDLNIFTQNSI